MQDFNFHRGHPVAATPMACIAEEWTKISFNLLDPEFQELKKKLLCDVASTQIRAQQTFTSKCCCPD